MNIAEGYEQRLVNLLAVQSISGDSAECFKHYSVTYENYNKII